MTYEERVVDGYTIKTFPSGATVKTPVQTEPTEPIEPIEPEPTLKEIQDTQTAIMSGIFDIYVAQLGM